MTAYNEKTEDIYSRQIKPVLLNSKADGSGTWFFPLNLVAKEVSAKKALVADADYAAGDVLSESKTAGTAWTFAAIARVNGGSGYITKVHAILETTAITARLAVLFFKATPTCELNDNATNTALVHADEANYIGVVELPPLKSIPAAGPGDSTALATLGSPGLPLAFTCASDSDDLFAVVASQDAITGEVDGDDLIIKVTVEQY